MYNRRSGVRAVVCAVFLSCSAASAVAGSEASLVSVSCDNFQRVGNTIRVNEDTTVVDDNWDGYSLHSGQRIVDALAADREKKLFTMIVKACKL